MFRDRKSGERQITSSFGFVCDIHHNRLVTSNLVLNRLVRPV
jgi:hypothetical protein